jgi:hypothetical protein
MGHSVLRMFIGGAKALRKMAREERESGGGAQGQPE